MTGFSVIPDPGGGRTMPAITGIAPAGGTPGTVVTINGSGFTSLGTVVQVHFPNGKASAVRVVGDTQLLATVGPSRQSELPASGPVEVVVRAASDGVLLGTARGSFTAFTFGIGVEGGASGTPTIPRDQILQISPDPACQDTDIKVVGQGFLTAAPWLIPSQITFFQPFRNVLLDSAVDIRSDKELRVKIPRALPNGHWQLRINMGHYGIATSASFMVDFKPRLVVKSDAPKIIANLLYAGAVQVLSHPAADSISLERLAVLGRAVGASAGLFSPGGIITAAGPTGFVLAGLLTREDMPAPPGSDLASTNFPASTTPTPIRHLPHVQSPHGFANRGAATATYKAGGQTFVLRAEYAEPLGKTEQLEAVRASDSIQQDLGLGVEFAVSAPTFHPARTDIYTRLILHRLRSTVIILNGAGYLHLLANGVQVAGAAIDFPLPGDVKGWYPWIFDSTAFHAAKESIGGFTRWWAQGEIEGEYLDLDTGITHVYSFDSGVLFGAVGTQRSLVDAAGGGNMFTNTGCPCGLFGIPAHLC